MVPPIYLGKGQVDEIVRRDAKPSLRRIGVQRTYVFYKNQVESFVIRPGFAGNVSEFGMLIPFPSAPAVRKVSDVVFEHIAAAVDPPEVVVDLQRRGDKLGGGGARRSGLGNASNPGFRLSIKKEDVRVLSEEAIGMYEVAVLQAGSSGALKKWMKSHGYRYPSGMDMPCDDYVKAKWCFAAVKAGVGRRRGVNPKPGQRSVSAAQPRGATFDGYVQAMEFRFRSRQLVVPMRLSAFNKGELRNIVYLLADSPARIRRIPEEYVVRQLSGKQLYDNLTGPLPMRIIGGRVSDVPALQWQSLKKRRDPSPYNGVARELFAADLLAARTGKLALPHEVSETELMNLGERLSLRGPRVDRAVRRTVQREREQVTSAALADLKRMTLTVIDGDFPRKVLAKENLTFIAYKMPEDKNHPGSYDARKMGPVDQEKGGVLKLGSLPDRAEYLAMVAAKEESGRGEPTASISPSRQTPWSAMALVTVVLGGVLVCGRRRRAARLVLLGTAVLWLTSMSAVAAPSKQRPKKLSAAAVRRMAMRLDHSATASAAADALVSVGEKAVPMLAIKAAKSSSPRGRGWAIVCLGEIGGEKARQALSSLYADETQHELVRMWAIAARVKASTSVKDLNALVALRDKFPAVARPLRLRYMDLISAGGTQTAESLIAATVKMPKLASLMTPMIETLSVDELVEVTLDAKDPDVREAASTHLTAVWKRGVHDVPFAVLGALRRSGKATTTAEVIKLSVDSPHLTTFLAAAMLDVPPGDVVAVMLTAPSTKERRQAAAYVATIGENRPKAGVAVYVVESLAFDSDAKQVPWHGGPLFVPMAGWTKKTARPLVRSLIAWHVWCDIRKLSKAQDQLTATLTNATIAKLVEYRVPERSRTTDWLRAWRSVAGEDGVAELLTKQDAQQRYSNLKTEQK